MIKKTIKKIVLKTVNYSGWDLKRIKKNLYENDPDYATYKKVLDIRGFLSFPVFKLFSHIKDLSLNNNANKNLPVLEIGVYCGMSLLGLGLIYKDKKIIGIDPFFEFFEGTTFDEEAKFLQHKSGYMSGKERLNTLLKKIESLEMSNRMRVEAITQEAYLENGKFEKHQLIYIDGEHTYKSVASFLDELDHLLAANGFLVFDDFLNQGFPGVTEATHTHVSYKKNLFPVCYAFNKAVFIYKPTEEYFAMVMEKTKQYIEKNGLKSRKCDNDDSLIIHE